MILCRKMFQFRHIGNVIRLFLRRPLKTRQLQSKAAFIIQRETGLILSILSFVVSVLNFYSGLHNFGNTPIQAFTHISVQQTFATSIILLITTLKDSNILRSFQVAIVLLTGISLNILTEPGNLTSTLFLLYGIVLAYQYGFFSTRLYLKIIILLMKIKRN